MIPIKQAAADFLAQKRIAVAGVSREPGSHGANVVCKRLRERGYEVFAVNPQADIVEGNTSYHDLASIPGGVDAVVIATPASAAEAVARECHDLGITRVWMHRSVDAGSVSPAATEFCRANGMTAIAGGCPLMFDPVSDFGHKAMCWWFTLTGVVPREV